MIVRLKETTNTIVGLLEPGLVDLPVADVLRLVKSGLVEIIEEDESEEINIEATRRNGMIKNYIIR